MDNVTGLLTDADFETGFESSVVPAGKYKMKAIKGNPRIKVAQSGNRYLTVRCAAIETLDGERVNSKIIYHSVPFEGTNKKGEPNRRMFASFLTALGIEKDAVKAIYAHLVETAPSASAIADAGEPTEVALELNGDKLSLDNRTFMASIKVEDYEGTESNKISSVWAVAGE